MDSCMTCKTYSDCTTRLGCNLVGCIGWEPVDNLNRCVKEDDIDKGICSNCLNMNECDLAMRNICLVPSKYIGYHRALKYKPK